VSIRGNEQESYYSDKLKDMRRQMDAALQGKDEEIRRLREAEEYLKRDMERMTKQRQDELDTQRREMTLTFDEVMRQQELESYTKTENLLGDLRTLESRYMEQGRELENERSKNSNLTTQCQTFEISLQDLSKREKSLRWDMEDSNKIKNSRISELEGEVQSLRTSKQSLMEEYESKMAELLKSLHNVERAFVSQKDKYDSQLSNKVREHEDVVSTLTAKFSKKQELTSSALERAEEEAERTTNELRKLSMKYNDDMSSKQREVESIQRELDELSANRDKYVKEIKDKLWEAELANKSLRESKEASHLQILERQEMVNRYKAELEGSLNREEELKKEIMNVNLRWEQRWTMRETELSSKHDAFVKTLQQQRDRSLLDNKDSDRHVLELENELNHLKIKYQESVGQLRILEATQRMENHKAQDTSISSPIFSEDMGPASPISGFSSPVRGAGTGALSISMPSVNTVHDFRNLREENSKLKFVFTNIYS
jgi:hypothetical protein